MFIPSQSMEGTEVSVRPMEESDLVEARRIFRVAFGTFLGVPKPEDFRADRGSRLKHLGHRRSQKHVHS